MLWLEVHTGAVNAETPSVVVASLVVELVVFGCWVVPTTVKLYDELRGGVVRFVVKVSCVLVGWVVTVGFIAMRKKR